MKILLTGSNGQLGWELARSLQVLGEVIALDRRSCDLSKPELLSGIIRSFNPEIIVNAGAYTAVDKAEEDENMASIVNGTSVGVLAEEARRNSIFLLHYSTDYIFDGLKSEPYTEEDIPNPINAYGRSKLKGEEYIGQVGCDHHILRSTWVYSSRGNNFLLTFLRLSIEKNMAGIVDDQFGAPTWARNLAGVSTHMLANRIWQQKKGEQVIHSGIYNVTAANDTTWFGFANSILAAANERGLIKRDSKFTVRPIKSSEYKLPAVRPKNSRFSGEKLLSVYGIQLPSWQKCIGFCLDDLCVTEKRAI